MTAVDSGHSGRSETGWLQSRLNTHALLRQTFIWMTVGLALTGIVAWATSQIGSLPDLIRAQPVASIASAISWLVLGLGFNFLVRRIPAVVGIILYFLYAVLTGVLLSGVFSTYTEATIVHALVSTVGLFVIITAFALLTRLDLTRWWVYIVFAILALILATVLNSLVFKSKTLDFILSYGGVILFAISTAVAVQKIVKMEHELDIRLHDRAAIIGAMMLYTNFINLFLRLLELYSRTQQKSQS